MKMNNDDFLKLIFIGKDKKDYICKNGVNKGFFYNIYFFKKVFDGELGELVLHYLFENSKKEDFFSEFVLGLKIGQEFYISSENFIFNIKDDKILIPSDEKNFELCND